MDVTQGRTYRGASPEQRQAERRERLIEAAIAVFGTTGYRAATVEQVCAQAGLTKRYFYESFADSEALLLAAYERTTDRLHERVTAAIAGAAPNLEAITRTALAEFIRAIDEDVRIARLVFFEILGVSPSVDAAYRAATGRFTRTLLGIASPAIKSTELTAAQQFMLATGLVGAILMIAQVWVLEDRRQPIESVIGTADLLVSAVLEQLRS
jgi:AcrR family transcriptional regulator